jgi:hypothetical protein
LSDAGVWHHRLVRVIAVIAVVTVTGIVLTTDALGGHGHRAGSGGVAITVPAKWHALRIAPALPHTGLVDPKTRIVAASSAIGFGRGCNDIDYRFAKNAVAIVVLEWVGNTPGTTWAKRPRRFTRHALPVRVGGVECFEGAGGSAQFVDHGRRFAAFLLAGSHARAATVTEARVALDSLQVTRR